MVMKEVNIAKLKAKLSYYLGQVRQGEEFLVMDRKTPVARVVPSGKGGGLMIRKAARKFSEFWKIPIRPLGRRIDVVKVLREDRDRR